MVTASIPPVTLTPEVGIGIWCIAVYFVSVEIQQQCGSCAPQHASRLHTLVPPHSPASHAQKSLNIARLLTCCCLYLLSLTLLFPAALTLAVDYNVSAFSSYSDISAMMCSGMWRTPMDPYVTPNIMRRLNWMLNTYYNPGVDGAVNCTLTGTVSPPFAQSQVTTGPGTYGPIRGADMQSAVWTLTGGFESVVSLRLLVTFLIFFGS